MIRNEFKKLINDILKESHYEDIPRDTLGRVNLDDITYEMESKKEVVTKIIATLKGKSSEVYTKLADRLIRLNALEAEMIKINEEVKQEGAREKIAALFGAEFEFSTRVIRTISNLEIVLTKQPKAAETTKWAKVFEELSAKLTPELIQIAESIVKKHTTIQTPKVPGLSIDGPGLDLKEGIGDVWKSFIDKLKTWGRLFDKRLDKVEKEIGEYSHAPEMRVRSDEPQFDDGGHGDVKDLDEEKEDVVDQYKREWKSAFKEKNVEKAVYYSELLNKTNRGLVVSAVASWDKFKGSWAYGEWLKKSEVVKAIKDTREEWKRFSYMGENLNERSQDTKSVPINGHVDLLVLKNERFVDVKDIGQNLVKVIIGGKSYNGVRFNDATIAISYSKGIESKTPNLASTVEGIKEYDYEGRVLVTVGSWEEPQPYGMGTVGEPTSDIDKSSIEDIKITTPLESHANLEVEEFLLILAEKDALSNGDFNL
jgi:hypothetical protein